jgi:electron transfer flavoprotein alpha subunit
LADLPLVLVELDEDGPTAQSLGILARARTVFGAAAAAVCGPGAVAAAAALGRFGADRVYLSDTGAPAGGTVSLQIDAVSQLVAAHGFSDVLFPGSSAATDAAGALSARLEAGVNWGLSDIALDAGELRGVRLSPDRALQTMVGWTTRRRLAVFARGAFATAPPAGPAGPAAVIPLPVPTRPRQQVIVRAAAAVSMPARTLGAADVIVAGGRGMREPSVLRDLEELARLVGGAVGVSMPIVDRGWYPYEHQVGSATPSVRPRIYIACGISGSLQHRIGMQESSFIVAINTDRDAPIMSFCDVGVVGDLHEVLPRLITLFRQTRRGERPEPV